MTDDYGGMAGFDWQAARREADAAEIDSLRTQLAEARAEVEALRKDAVRWRWARCNPIALDDIPIFWIDDEVEAFVDSAISAMGSDGPNPTSQR